MRYTKFYHSILPALLLAYTATATAAALPANGDTWNAEPLPAAPPHSIHDITRMLAHYKPNEREVAKNRAIADTAPPQTEDSNELFNFYWQRGLAAAELGRVPQQLADLRQASTLLRPGTKEALRMLRNLATAEMLGGNILTARKLLEEVARQIPQNSFGHFTGTYGQLVSVDAQLGDFESAQNNLRQLDATMAVLKSKSSWNIYSHFWLNALERARGDLFRMSGQTVEAEGAYRKALREAELAIVDIPSIARQTGGDVPTVETMRMTSELLEAHIARMLLAQGKIIEAEAMARTALRHSLERTGNTSVEVGRGLSLLAYIINEQGRHAESGRLIDAAIDSLLKSGAAPDAISVINTRRAAIAVHVAQGKYKEALQVLDTIRQSVRDKQDLSEKVLVGDLDVALALLRTGQAKDAVQMTEGMLESARKRFGEKAVRTAEIRAFHAMAQADLAEPAAALLNFRTAIPILIEQARQDGESETGSLRKQQRLVIIIERYIQLLGELDGKHQPDLDPVNESFMLADIARGSSVQRALTRSAARAAIKDPALAELARQEQDAQRRINSLNELLGQLLSARPDQQLPAIQARIASDIDTLKQIRNRLKAEIQQRFPDYAQLVDPPSVNVRQVQKILRHGEVLLSWYFGEQAAHVWGITDDGRTRFASLPLNRKIIASKVAELRQALNPEVATIDQIPPFDVTASHHLYQQIAAPVADLFDGAATLLAVPHAELGQLPLSLLVSAPAQQPAAGSAAFTGYRGVPWLMRKLAIAQIPSVTALTSLRQLPAGSPDRLPFIGFGDPYFSEEQAAQAEKQAATGNIAMRGIPLKLRSVPKTQAVDSAELALLPRLPDTAVEIREIAAALGAEPARDIFLQRAASEKTVFSANLANRRVVMFATHGLVPGELDGLTLPALALSAPKVTDSDGDGLLTQEEILSLRLNADWVVLSACNTAAGEGSGSEAVSGLGRAFFYAGARALLVSNWPVETEAARGLMTDLFKRQAANLALSKAEALRQAMRNLMDGPGRVDIKTGKSIFSYAHPLFWAPFVLVGD